MLDKRRSYCLKKRKTQSLTIPQNDFMDSLEVFHRSSRLYTSVFPREKWRILDFRNLVFIITLRYTERSGIVVFHSESVVFSFCFFLLGAIRHVVKASRKRSIDG